MSTTTKVVLCVIAVLIFIAGFFLAKYMYDQPGTTQPPQIEYRTDTLFVRDTLRLPPVKTKAKIDTVWVVTYINPTVTDSVEQVIAKADTTVTVDGATVKLYSEYHYPPRNYFTHKLSLFYDKPIIKDTVTITKYAEETFWDRFGIGIGIGAIADFREWKAGYGAMLGIYYRIK